MIKIPSILQLHSTYRFTWWLNDVQCKQAIINWRWQAEESKKIKLTRTMIKMIIIMRQVMLLVYASKARNVLQRARVFHLALLIFDHIIFFLFGVLLSSCLLFFFLCFDSACSLSRSFVWLLGWLVLCASVEILLCCKSRCQSVSGNNTLLCWHIFPTIPVPRAIPFCWLNSCLYFASFLFVFFFLIHNTATPLMLLRLLILRQKATTSHIENAI